MVRVVDEGDAPVGPDGGGRDVSIPLGDDVVVLEDGDGDGRSLEAGSDAEVRLEAALNLGLSLWLVRTMGILGVAIGTLVPAVVLQGVVQGWYVSGVLGVGRLRYLWEVVRGVAPAFAAMWGASILVERFIPGTGWMVFLVKAALVGTPGVAAALLLSAKPDERRKVLKRLPFVR